MFSNYVNHNSYNLQQREALKGVVHAVNTLVDYENLKARASMPQISLEGHRSAAVADIRLDTYPPHDVLKQRLKEQVIRAREIGLADDPLVKKCSEMSGLDKI